MVGVIKVGVETSVFHVSLCFDQLFPRATIPARRQYIAAILPRTRVLLKLLPITKISTIRPKKLGQT